MYFNENHKQYIADAAVTLTSGNQYLIANTHGEQPLQTSPEEKIKIDLLHATVGLATELGELLPLAKHSRDIVNVKEEIGDLCWYLAIIDRFLISNGFVLEIAKYEKDLLFEEAEHGLLYLTLNKLLDQSKKNFIYGKPYELTLLFNTTMKLHGCLMTICKFYCFDIDEIRSTNIAKLKKRYGDKFSAAAALNRDVNAEREILEISHTTPVQG